MKPMFAAANLESRLRRTLASGVLPDAGLTGLLNPTSIWHETISIVFHKVLHRPSSRTG
jgi:hypothetical protein